MENNIAFALITLNEGKDFMKRNLEYSAIDYQFFGCNGSKMIAADYFKTMFSDHHVLLSPSELGTRNSHIAALESFTLSESNFYCIFEDDVTIDIEKFNQLVDSKSYKDYDFLHLGGLNGLKIEEAFSSRKYSRTPFKLNRLELNSLWRACGYIVSKEGAKKILRSQNNDILVADNWRALFKNAKLNFGYYDCVNHPLNLDGSLLEKDRKKLSGMRSKKIFLNICIIINKLLVLILGRFK